jgi:hypothetical protein
MFRQKLLAYIQLKPGLRIRELRKGFPDRDPRAIRACLDRLRNEGQIELRGHAYHLATDRPQSKAGPRPYESSIPAPSMARLMGSR